MILKDRRASLCGQGWFVFSSLKGALIILIRLLALDDFSCTAGTHPADHRQVKQAQMNLFQHVDYANSKKQSETLLFNFVGGKNPTKP